MKKVLTIAGSDTSGGAGIQADIKTITMLGAYAMSAISSLTAQNTMGVSSIMNVTPEFLSEQLDDIFTDIFPDAVKIGMVSSAELAAVIVEKLEYYTPLNIVIDPLMMATSGASLVACDAVEVLKSTLFPFADLLTPNIPEAEFLSGIVIKSYSDMKNAARIISEEFACNVLVKGGHSDNSAYDVLYRCNGKTEWFCSKKIDNKNTHGTGCTLSSAIATELAKGRCMISAVANAKMYLSGAIKYGLDLGKGSGPLAHNYMIIN